MKRKILFLLALLLAIVTQGTWAETVTITTTSNSPGASEKTFTSDVVTIKVYNVNELGAFINDIHAMTITATDKYITSVVLRIGYYADDTEEVLASSGTRSISDKQYNELMHEYVYVNGNTWVTFSDVNASSVTITTKRNWVEIDEVTVNYTSIVAVSGVTLSQSEAVLTVGGTQTLTATVAPAIATNKSVTWTTSNPSVATVANGVVTAVGVGSATITATTTDGAKTASCAVTVANPIAATSADGTIGAFTDANGQTRLGIVATLGGKKYAIGMSNETDISGLSGASTRKVGSITYYNNADARAKFANNQNEYTAANVWRLPTDAEFSALVALGGTWDGTTGHEGYTWTIGGNTLFMPISGYYEGGVVQNAGWGYYWSSSSSKNMMAFTSWYPAATNTGGTTAGMPLRLFCQLPYVNVTGVTLAQTEAILPVDGTLTLTPTIAPANATDKSVTWTTSDASVATVDANGVVTALGLGTTTITATATNGTADTSDDLTATCTVTVATPITAASADGTVGVFTDANSQTRIGIVATLDGKKYAIAMSNETDITGLSGTYTKKVGDYTYYNFADACAKFANNKTNGSYTAANVWRLPTAAEFTALKNLGGSWNGTGYTWTIGGNSLFLPAAGYIDASPVSGVGFYWSSTQPQFLYFNNGSIFMINGGTSSGMPLRLFCQIPYVNVTGVTLAQTEGVLTVGETLTLTATIAPTNATDKSVTWTTSNASVATVANGVVTAVGVGSATITATATNGTADTSDDVTATCTVNVVYPWAGSGTYDDPFQIQNVDDWNTLAANVTGGETYSGIYFKMTDDIIGVTTRTGKNSLNPFSGTFDGQGHTMNLNIYTTTTADVTSAPFGYISGATIKNLHITGSETTTAYMRAASIAGFAANSTITNCWSEVALTSGYNKDIDCGAFVATVQTNSSLTLNGCLFTGTITYTNAAGYEGGGMVGWTRDGGTATLNDCLFAPADFTVTKYYGHYMFVGGKKRGVLNNCYYNDVAAATNLIKEGKQAFSIVKGDDVSSLAISGEGTEYSVSGITAYATGLKYNDVYYAGSADNVSLTLSHGDAATGYSFDQYTASAGTLSGTTLTMPDADVTISATWTKNTKTLAETATDNQAWLTENDGQVYEITLTRTLQTGGWNTFCAPFSTETPSGWTVKKLTSSELNSETGELTLTFDNASSIEAGKPYLVKVTANVENPTFNGVTISSTTTTTETTAVDFVPVMKPTNLTGGDKTVLFVTGGKKLTYPSADGNINGFRAYFKLKDEVAAQARAFRMSFDDDATGITIVLSDEPTTASGTYTLDGRRIEGEPTQRSAEGRLYPQGLKKGMYIVNGKKVIK